ncbi:MULTISPECIES: DUF3558 family protein [Amycolatopsis]|uniref:DUF3558 domain-containing protein n=2 Tax=Amycolatopsis TaxID=1813 RepID=A0A1I4CYZ7_9PSEU|nr:DUF3558 family protein [Amycolatopsis sacchari]SFK85639.1 Protein of unknown function [Amycolatopsis sacchari]
MARRFPALLLAAAWLPAACGAQAAPPASPPASSPSPSALPAPCGLLSSVDRSQAGLTSLGQEKTIGVARACDWTETGTFGLTVTVDDTAAVSDLRTGEGNQRTVGRHQALEVADREKDDGTCAVLLDVEDRASVQVDVSNANFRDTGLACRRAETVALLVEPKLP